MILLGVPSGIGPLNFYTDPAEIFPGLAFNVVPGIAIDIQIMDAIQKTVGLLPGSISIQQDFAEPLSADERVSATLYLAVSGVAIGKNDRWQTLPAILRKMDKDRRRIAYVKAWQVLSGSLDLDTRAVEVPETPQ